MALIKRKATFSRPDEDYYITKLRNSNLWSDRQLFKEYQRLRDIARKRLNRLSETEFAKGEFFQTWKDTFKKAPSELNRRDLVHKVFDIHTFLKAEESTVKGAREKKARVIEEVAKAVGGGKVLHSNEVYKTFTEFMNYAESVLASYQYSSDDLVELWEQNIDGVQTMSWDKLGEYLKKWGGEQDRARKENIARAEFWKKFSSDNLGVFGY